MPTLVHGSLSEQPLALWRSRGALCGRHELTAGVLSQVHGSLEGLGSQPVWQQEDASASAGGGVLPSFSAYPQQSVTSAGEYLMMMPQTLEGLLGSGDDAEDQMDSEWLDKVRH